MIYVEINKSKQHRILSLTAMSAVKYWAPMLTLSAMQQMYSANEKAGKRELEDARTDVLVLKESAM